MKAAIKENYSSHFLEKKKNYFCLFKKLSQVKLFFLLLILKEFFGLYVEKFIPNNGIINFDNLRKFTLQRIDKELSHFFKEKGDRLLMINILNISFLLFNEHLEKNFGDFFLIKIFFEHLFYTSFFLTIKVK